MSSIAHRPIKLAAVSVSRETRHLIDSLLRNGHVGQTAVIEEFEKAFATWLGVKHCVAVCSGTMADTIALAVLKAQHPGKTEVILPALTFAAQLNSVLYNGLTPVFVDHGIDDRGLVTPQTLCRFPVHLLGRVSKNAYRPSSVPIVEDACEAMGTSFSSDGYVDVKCGTVGTMGTFSFFPSHTVTTGEGGMIATNDAECAALARRLRNHGKSDGQMFRFDLIGFNGKMATIPAALGMGLLPTISGAIAQRRRNYLELGGHEEPWEYVCPHAFPVLCVDQNERDRALDVCRAEGIECRNVFSSLPTQEKAYRRLGYDLGDFPIAEDIGRRAFYVPVHQGLTSGDMETIKRVLGTIKSEPWPW